MRGKFVILTKDGIYTSTEFPKDMEWQANGPSAVKAMAKVSDTKSLEAATKEFRNSYYSDMPDAKVIFQSSKKKGIVFKTSGYYTEWASEYLYIKNLLGKTVGIQLTNEAVGDLPDGETCSVVNGKRFDIENYHNVEIFGEDLVEPLPEPEPEPEPEPDMPSIEDMAAMQNQQIEGARPDDLKVDYEVKDDVEPPQIDAPKEEPKDDEIVKSDEKDSAVEETADKE